MKTQAKRYRVFLTLLLVNLALVLAYPAVGYQSLSISLDSLMEMLVIVPPVFILLGLFDVWVPREAIIKLLGQNSGFLGVGLALALGSFSAGPLYAAFPVAAVLLAKGSRLSNVIIFIGAWATTKVPMLLFEAGSMGWRFMLIRLLINIPGVILMAGLLELFTTERDRALLYDGPAQP